jgi:hypothetical protein
MEYMPYWDIILKRSDALFGLEKLLACHVFRGRVMWSGN